MKIRSILLAAGQGTRLRPITDVVPKVALPLLDVPLGAFGLALLAPYGQLLVNTSHLSDAVAPALVPWGLEEREIFFEGATPLGTAGTLKALSARLAETFVTLNADELIDADPIAVLEAHRHSGATATLAVAPVTSGADLEVRGHRVTRFIDRRTHSIPGVAFLGLAVYSRSVVSLIPDGRSGIAEVVLRPLVEKGEVGVHVHEGYALDVGTPGRYLRASLDLLEGRGPKPPGPFPGSIIEVNGGRAYLGPDALADEGSLGAGAILLSGARVEGRVQESIVWTGATVGPGETLTRSIRFSTQTIAATPM
jgi:mannose-1-phosphate guanylyltransferase